MVSTISFVVDGPPPRKNERHEIVVPRNGRVPFMVNSDAFRSFVLRLTNAWRRAGGQKIRAGEWSITVHAFWSRRRRLDVDVPMGDLDAPLSAVLDALQFAGVVDDDVRFTSGALLKGYDKGKPRTIIVLVPVDPGAEQIGLIPPAAS